MSRGACLGIGTDEVPVFTLHAVSMRQCIIKVMVVFGQYFLQLLKMLPLGACDVHGCLVHLGDRVVVSFVLSPSLW